MNILDRPGARALLADAELSAAAVRPWADRLTAFAQRFLPLFLRAGQRGHARTVLCGKLTGLQRKTTEPKARSRSRGCWRRCTPGTRAGA